jgi:hypothetical protein
MRTLLPMIVDLKLKELSNLFTGTINCNYYQAVDPYERSYHIS